MSPERTVRWARTAERLLGVLGAGALLWCTLVLAEAFVYQHEAQAALDRAATAPGTGGPEYIGLIDGRWVVGRLELPRLKLSVMVVEGDDGAALRVAAGHLRETPLPWAPGNSVIAGHRDTFFRGLQSVELHDRVRIVTGRGARDYRVSRIAVVDPTDLSVLSSSGGRSVTLITCYPFTYVGRAPLRFVVQADAVPASSEARSPISARDE